MAGEKFKAGDVVKLASGGPAMTVCGKGTSEGTVSVRWFDANGTLQTNSIEAESLVKVPHS